jgi:hypothetical protein
VGPFGEECRRGVYEGVPTSERSEDGVACNVGMHPGEDAQAGLVMRRPSDDDE